ncbi:hypothetical protein ACF1AY_15950 [Streptomyces sp. NPDC014776]|uniref:hypothetical protein n=1 Tax=unclassified Streptomyces TaxID=2593676 RepID=UPI0036F5D4DB
MSYRPYPNVDRALAQVERGRVPEPPRPPLRSFEEFAFYLQSGEFQKRMQAIAESVAAVLARNQARRGGKAAITTALTDQAVKAGEVVHIATRRGLRCAGGAEHECTLLPLRPDRPLVLARVERTGWACPSQWNAWTVDGQYLYLRYRSGIGTVDAYDTEDYEQWTRFPGGRVAIFDTGEQYGGEMALTEFCERAGLQLADEAEVTGE